MLKPLAQYLRRKRRYLGLPARAKDEIAKDRKGLPHPPPNIDMVREACIAWLCRAQDCSLSRDGGVARDFSLIRGWASSYPETTGYIVPTLLDRANETNSAELRARARRMLDWLEQIQLPGGAYQGGKIDSRPFKPVTFNTGQILLGLARGVTEFGAYGDAMRAAANWLVETQDEDGCWRRFPTPFARPGEKSYETHVAWGLFEAARVEPTRGYERAAEANIRWALKAQRENGWFEKCCLDDPSAPLTHTLGYVIRGLVEAYRFTGNSDYLEAAKLSADGVLSALRDDGFLPGRLLPDWSPGASYACLTGTAQNAYCWLFLHEELGDSRYLDAGRRANAFVCSTVAITGDPDIRGGVKGSFPVDGRYGAFQYPNWAPKFLFDSLTLERKLTRR